jgi:5-bromo-4-chloroindolyl phosphate hydrolysis protein
LDFQKLKNLFEIQSLEMINDMDIRLNILKQIYNSIKQEAETLKFQQENFYLIFKNLQIIFQYDFKMIQDLDKSKINKNQNYK